MEVLLASVHQDSPGRVGRIIKRENPQVWTAVQLIQMMELMQSLVLSKFCLNCRSTSLQDSILKQDKGAVSNVQNT